MFNFKQLTRRKTLESILQDQKDRSGSEMRRTLGVRDLTFLGIAAVIGAGIFATIGQVCSDGGPGVILLFIMVAVACGFSALCYASFSSLIPISGSAYTYAYASFGELVAWIIGWDLIIEYAIGNITVAISWSNYFTEILKGFGLHIPYWLATDYMTAHNAFLSGDATSTFYQAWVDAPVLMGIHVVLDVPAFLIVILITALIYIGIRESRNASNAMVILKLAVIVVVIIAGAFYVQPENWSPFMPHGFTGVLKGVAGVFFAYIGFDAVSTTAEECKDPQRDLPKGMIFALIICTVLYILVALVVTGMVPSDTLAGVGDPLAFIFKSVNADWVAFIVSISAIVAMASVLLVFQLGQPRIWMSMSRDGLLPPIFSRIHPRYKTPAFATIVTGLLVGIPAMLLNITVVTDLTSIGTLFAFVLVCGGVIVLDVKHPEMKGKFKIPYWPAKYFLPLIWVGVVGTMAVYFPENLATLIPATLQEFEHMIPLYVFLLTGLGLTVFSFRYRISLIPALGMLSCLYLMSEIPTASWWRLFVWFAVGLVIYFAYGHRNSRLRRTGDGGRPTVEG
ncbi:MAG: amino acid permease [Saprospirales bacterium]|nr:amino acid permease [Saprospirales bacterium]